MTAGAPRILVSSDAVADAHLVRGLLSDEFDSVSVSADPGRAVQDFEKYRPGILILAFNGLEKAERYYLGLYRLSTVARALPHRTVILCNKDELQRVYALCKKEHFDDYVLFWPLTNDAPRLAMAVHHAARQLAADSPDRPSARDFAVHARRLGAMASMLESCGERGGRHIEEMNRSLEQARSDIDRMLEALRRAAPDAEQREIPAQADATGSARHPAAPASAEIATRLQAVASAVQPVRDWATALRSDLAAHAESTRELQAMAGRVRPLVLHVDDDGLQRRLVGALLRDADIELVSASCGTEALALVRRHTPDLILMDVDLPDMDGVEATRQLKCVDRFAGVPVLMITGRSDRSVVEQSARAGAAGFLVKPFNKETLLAKVEHCLEHVNERAAGA